MLPRVFITAAGVLAPIGTGADHCFEALCQGRTALRFDELLGLPSGRLPADAEAQLTAIAGRHTARRLDRTALLAIAAAEQAVGKRNGLDPDRTGVIVGTSRGATISLEKFHTDYLRRGQPSPSMSPVTTGVTLSAAAAEAICCRGPVFSVTAACMGGLTAIGTAFGLIRAGQAAAFLAGGAEASLTGFTAGSLNRLGLLSDSRGAFPLQPGEPARPGTVLSEGAALCLLEAEASVRNRGSVPMAEVVGFAQRTEHAGMTGISERADALRQCLAAILDGRSGPDLVIGHFAGTRQGDSAEAEACRLAVPPSTPVVALKWSTGHMLAASPSFSVTVALKCLKRGIVPGAPYATGENIIPGLSAATVSRDLRSVIVTALGFGGGAAAVMLQIPS
jgi:3-oxoacyl-[acyl-carrier-protein] synthase II